MDTERPINVVGCHFGNALITWKIVNFYFETSRESVLISTPEFLVDGPHLTKWKIRLNPKFRSMEEEFFLLTFERTGSDGAPAISRADISIWMLDSNGKRIDTMNTRCSFERRDRKEITLWSVSDICERLKVEESPNEPLRICCRLILNFEGYPHKTLEDTSYKSLKVLSQDFRNLYHSGQYHDITLKCKDNETINAHKAILCAQNQYFLENIKPDCNELDLPDVDHETMKDLVEFLYTGDINIIAMRPSVLMIEYALRFKVSEINTYYESHKVQVEIESVIDVREDTVVLAKMGTRWNSGDVSPSLTSYMGRTFGFLFGDLLDENAVRHLSIYALIQEGTLPNCGCLQLSIYGDKDEVHSKRLAIFDGTFMGRPGFDKFISAEEYDDFCSRNGIEDICVALTLEEHTDTVSSTQKYSISHAVMSVDNYYNSLIKIMETNLEKTPFSDISIESEGKLIKVHKFVLWARCPVLGSMIDQATDGKISMPTMKYNVLLNVIHFLYIGFCKNLEINETFFEVCKVAEELSLPSLKQNCLAVLEAKFNPHSVCEALKYSDACNDVEFYNSALKFMRKNKDIFFQEQDWKSLLDNKPHLCNKVLESVQNFEAP